MAGHSARFPGYLVAGALIISLWAAAAGCTATPQPDPIAATLADAAQQMDSGHYTAAETLYEQALAAAPSDPRPALGLAQLYLQWQRLQAGWSAAGQARARGAGDEVVGLLELKLLEQAGQWAQLQATAESMLQSAPGNADALAALTIADAALGSCDAAQEAARVWHAAAPDTTEARRAAGSLDVDMELVCAADPALCAAVRDAPEPERSLALGQALIRQEAWWLASCVLERTKPRSAETLLWLGEAYARLGRIQEGRAALEQATVLDPTQPAAWLLLGKLHLSEGNAETARRAFVNAQRLDPENPVACLAVAEALAQAGRYDEVEIWNTAALRRAPQDVAIWNAVARFYLNRYLQQGDFPSRAIEGALALDPANAEAHMLQGIALLRTEDAAGALNSLDQALRLNRGLAEAHYWRGQALAAVGRPDEARKAYECAADLGFGP